MKNCNMSNRIQITKNKESLKVVIKAFYDDKKQKMLLLWIVLFSLCGVAIISQFFEDYDSGTKVFFGVYVAFWLFKLIFVEIFVFSLLYIHLL